MPETTDRIINQTQCWLDSIVIKHNLCPFAGKERDSGRIRFCVDDHLAIEQSLEHLVSECELLEQQTGIETTLFVFANICQEFEEFLDVLELAQQLLSSLDYDGIFQLASFHPEYRFAGSSGDDPANYSNRSPYPMLHIIREASLERALQHYPNPEAIPQRNVQWCRDQGLKVMQHRLQLCCK